LTLRSSTGQSHRRRSRKCGRGGPRPRRPSNGNSWHRTGETTISGAGAVHPASHTGGRLTLRGHRVGETSVTVHNGILGGDRRRYVISPATKPGPKTPTKGGQRSDGKGSVFAQEAYGIPPPHTTGVPAKPSRGVCLMGMISLCVMRFSFHEGSPTADDLLDQHHAGVMSVSRLISLMVLLLWDLEDDRLGAVTRDRGRRVAGIARFKYPTRRFAATPTRVLMTAVQRVEAAVTSPARYPAPARLTADPPRTQLDRDLASSGSQPSPMSAGG